MLPELSFVTMLDINSFNKFYFVYLMHYCMNNELYLKDYMLLVPLLLLQ